MAVDAVRRSAGFAGAGLTQKIWGRGCDLPAPFLWRGLHFAAGLHTFSLKPREKVREALLFARCVQPCRSHRAPRSRARSEEHTSELQSLMRISYAVFCLKKKKQKKTTNDNTI